MEEKRSDVLGGFNGFIKEQKKIEEDKARLYLVKFNTVVSVVHKGLELKDVPELTKNNYIPGGGTALYDAIAEGVRLANKDKKAEERVICVIMTDGEENSSRETTKQQIKDIISGYEAKGDWTFLYIGENPERWANDTGMSSRHALADCDRSVLANYEMVTEGVSAFRLSSDRKGTDLFSSEPKRSHRLFRNPFKKNK